MSLTAARFQPFESGARPAFIPGVAIVPDGPFAKLVIVTTRKQVV
jgi:hypothetical protein